MFINAPFNTRVIRRASSPVSHLVVDLELHQRGVAVHGFDDRHHAVGGDEVGLDVEALQAGVLLQHLGTGLSHTHTQIQTHHVFYWTMGRKPK